MAATVVLIIPILVAIAIMIMGPNLVPEKPKKTQLELDVQELQGGWTIYETEAERWNV